MPSANRLPLTDLLQRKGFVLGDNELEKTVALLLWMAADFQSSIEFDEMHYAALEVILKHAHDATGRTLGSLHTTSLAKLSKLIDIMMLHKNGVPKDAKATLRFMRRLDKIREEIVATSRDNATERVELNEDEVRLCYQRFGRILLTNDLRPYQWPNERYWVQSNYEGDTHLSSFQRSFIDNLLRKNLGNKKVAFRIWQHGIPSIADRPVTWRRRVDSKVLDMDMLQSGLDECLEWYTCLANDIVVYQSQESFEAQLSASSLDELERRRQQMRREALQNAQDDLRLGAALAKQRDDKKRLYNDMNKDEQKILEEYETGRTKKAKQGLTTPRMNPFRSKMQINH